MIDFETPEAIKQQLQVMQMVAGMLRSVSREYDERESEHAKPMELYNMMWEQLKQQNLAAFERNRRRTQEGEKASGNGHAAPKRTSTASMSFVHTIETMAWGDVGLYLSIPSSGLGGAAIEGAGTPEQ